MAGKAPAVAIEQTESGDYALGAVVDGIFVPFVSKAGVFVDAIVTKGKANAPASSSKSSEEE